ncbi:MULTISPECIES: hypothetical protein [unclassified Lonepinella]|uniref:hypothetical protein n=1 Tax=unclassified Lonepinella TaxID=2642006 RepID=UPI0036DE6C4D
MDISKHTEVLKSLVQEIYSDEENLKEKAVENILNNMEPIPYDDVINSFEDTIKHFRNIQKTQEKLINNISIKSKDNISYEIDLIQLKQINEILKASIEINLDTMLRTHILRLSKLAEIMPTVERKINGKKPKSKKIDQINAEEWAKEVWETHPKTTQEQMAIDIKDKLDLKQSLQTIIRWIRPFQPPKVN